MGVASQLEHNGAWISGDRKMMDLILKPDPCFARVKASSRYVNEKGEVDEDTVCRLTFPDHVQGDNRKWVMTYGVAGEVLKRFTHEDLVWGPDGRPIYAKQDLHWSLAEMAHKLPREELVAKRDRGASKIVNFSSAYGASGATLERKIESDTGIKPEPGEGQRMLDALTRRQPRAFEFMEEMERVPKDPGYLIAKSGRVRHFHLHSESLVGEWAYRGMAGAQGREARNFFMQESVGATAARASVWLYRFKRKFGLRGRPIAVLYDSVVTLCPNDEREIWKKAHDLFMWLGNGWAYEDRVLRYPVDHELNQSWSFKPTKEQLERIENTALADTDEARSANRWLDTCLALVRDNEQLSTHGCDWMFDRIKTG